MKIKIIIILIIIKMYKCTRVKLIDSRNENMILGARSDTLVLLNKKDAEIENINVIFDLDLMTPYLDHKKICDYGPSESGLWMCKHANSFGVWIIDVFKNDKEHKIIRDPTNDNCAGYDEEKDRNILIKIVSCKSDKVIKFYMNYEDSLDNTKDPNHNKNRGDMNETEIMKKLLSNN